jgi:hypothetical protein
MIQAEAVILTYPNGNREFFIHKNEINSIYEGGISKALSDRAYYKNGVVSKKTLFKDSREIYVSFKNSIDLEMFKNKYNLSLLKEINEIPSTYLFKIQDRYVDVVELCSAINQGKDIKYAKPNWKLPKFASIK